MRTQNNLIIKEISTTLILLVFLIVPTFIAIYYYRQEVDKNMPLMKSKHGFPVSPTIDISQITFMHSKVHLRMDYFHGKWLIVYALPTCCHFNCHHNLLDLQHILKSTGKNQARLAFLLLTPKSCPKQNLIHYMPDNPVMATWGNFSKTQTNIWNKKMHAAGRHLRLIKKAKFYFINPEGQLFKYYEENTRSATMQNDLHKLLGLANSDKH